MQTIEELREFLKDSIRLKIDSANTDQNKGVPAPPIQKPCDPSAELFDLPSREDFADLGKIELLTAINNRQSRRKFTEEPINLKELAFLLWVTQGIKEVHGHSSLRTVPSAGARHSFEAYVYARLVEGLDEAIYRYLALDHKLVKVREGEDLSIKMGEACLGQGFCGKSAATFVWTTTPYRTEWRYLQSAHRTIAIDAGHVCQNLYLACESIGCGTCGIGAYDQEKVDALLGVDGKDEFAIYIAPVGKI